MTTTTTVPQRTQEQRREETIASVLGKTSIDEIDWRTLLKQGVLVRLRISRCRFAAKLDLDDLGVSVSDERVRQSLARTLVLGEKRLLPQGWLAQLEKIESRARRLLARCSFNTELGAFLPVSAYATWKRESQVLEAQYFQLRDEIIERYESLVDLMMEEYAIVAADTYQRLRETNPDVLTQGQEEFVASYCRRVRALIPTRDLIRSTFAFTVTLKGAVREVEGAGVLDSVDVERGTSAQGSEVLQQLRVAADAREFQQSFMERDLIQQEREQKQALLDSFLTTIVGQMRALIYEVTTDVLATMKKRQSSGAEGEGATFAPRSVVQLKNLIAQVKLINFFGDEEIERLLSQLQGIASLNPEARQASLGEIEQKMCAIATTTRATLLALGDQPRSARAFSVPDVPAEPIVRQARTSLGLDLDTQDFLLRFETRQERLYAAGPLWPTPEGGERPRRLA